MAQAKGSRAAISMKYSARNLQRAAGPSQPIPHAPATRPMTMKVSALHPRPNPAVVGEGFMPSRERAGINPAPTVGVGGRRPGEGDFRSNGVRPLFFLISLQQHNIEKSKKE